MADTQVQHLLSSTGIRSCRSGRPSHSAKMPHAPEDSHASRNDQWSCRRNNYSVGAWQARATKLRRLALKGLFAEEVAYRGKVASREEIFFWRIHEDLSLFNEKHIVCEPRHIPRIMGD